jgi:hypothetical protein
VASLRLANKWLERTMLGVTSLAGQAPRRSPTAQPHRCARGETPRRPVTRGSTMSITAMRSCAAALLLGAAFAFGCASNDVWEDVESVVFTLDIPDSASAGQEITARVTGVCGAPPCYRFDGVSVAHSNAEWVLRPLSRRRTHPSSPCPPADRFFDESVTLPGLDPGLVRVRAVSYGHDLVDSVLVLRR